MTVVRELYQVAILSGVCCTVANSRAGLPVGLLFVMRLALPGSGCNSGGQNHVCPALRGRAGQESLKGAASGSGFWYFPAESGLVVAGADVRSLKTELVFLFLSLFQIDLTLMSSHTWRPLPSSYLITSPTSCREIAKKFLVSSSPFHRFWQLWPASLRHFGNMESS